MPLAYRKKSKRAPVHDLEHIPAVCCQEHNVEEASRSDCHEVQGADQDGLDIVDRR